MFVKLSFHSPKFPVLTVCSKLNATRRIKASAIRGILSTFRVDFNLADRQRGEAAFSHGLAINHGGEWLISWNIYTSSVHLLNMEHSRPRSRSLVKITASLERDEI
ncbi:hypothetical protein J6590_055355 [Homalodisca vitripennis]|nr:hypothetical protein J6590_055355 [Homalodisca vitripennis]